MVDYKMKVVESIFKMKRWELMEGIEEYSDEELGKCFREFLIDWEWGDNWDYEEDEVEKIENWLKDMICNWEVKKF